MALMPLGVEMVSRMVITTAGLGLAVGANVGERRQAWKEDAVIAGRYRIALVRRRMIDHQGAGQTADLGGCNHVFGAVFIVEMLF